MVNGVPYIGTVHGGSATSSGNSVSACLRYGVLPICAASSLVLLVRSLF
jgi:hypothetical protein